MSEDSVVRCPWCNGEYVAENWNTNTYEECRTREMRRAFKSIYTKAIWGKNSQNSYKCPGCGMWSCGSQLRLLDKDGNTVRGMGGQPIMRITSRAKN